ncbi:MAG TPA: dihydrofolate reductase family protein [Microbacteriaceae bacterium]
MTRVIYNTATSFNGYIADAANSLDWLFAVDEDGAEAPEVFMDGVGVLVEGSTTYEWVLRETKLLDEPQKWQDFYGARPTYVFTSRELPRPAGADVRFVRGAVRDAMPAIRQAAVDKDIWVVGGGDLAGQFFDVGELDEIALSVAPVALKSGAPLLPRLVDSQRLTLTSVEKQGQLARLIYTVNQWRAQA